MTAKILTLTVGIALGILVTLVAIRFVGPKNMITVSQSEYDFDTTVDMIKSGAVEMGWKVPKVYDLRKSLTDAGQADVSAVNVISLCQPEHAYSILSDDKTRNVSGMMPCRIAVYETSDGRVLISHMNVGLMSSVFGGKVADVMGSVSDEQRQIMTRVLPN